MAYLGRAFSDRHAIVPPPSAKTGLPPQPLTDVEVQMYGFWHPTEQKLVAIRARLSSKFADFLSGKGGSPKYKFQLFGRKCRVNLKRMTVDLDAKGDDQPALNNLPLVQLSKIRENRVMGTLKRGMTLPADTGDQRLLNEHFVIDADSFIIAVHTKSVEKCEELFLQTSNVDFESMGGISKADWFLFKEKTKWHTCRVEFKVVREHPTRLFKATDLRIGVGKRDPPGLAEGTKEAILPSQMESPVLHLTVKEAPTLPVPAFADVIEAVPLTEEQSKMWPPVRDAIRAEVTFIHTGLKRAALCECTESMMRTYILPLDGSVKIVLRESDEGHSVGIGDVITFEEYEPKDGEKTVIRVVYVIPAEKSPAPEVSEAKTSPYQLSEAEEKAAEKEAEEMGLPMEYWKDIQDTTQQISMLMKHTQTVCGSWLPTISQDLFQMKSKVDKLTSELKSQES